MFIALVVLCVLIIDAIRYRIIYFKYKRLGIYDFKEINESLNQTKVGSIKVPSMTPEEAEKKMIILTTMLSYLSTVDQKKLEFLTEDIDFLLDEFYEKVGQPLVNTMGQEYEELYGEDEEEK